VVSAHRTPEAMLAYGREAYDRGLRVIIAGAGGAAHLPGMVASVTTLPVIGVPVPLRHLDGLDSLLSIVQMPAGIPGATVSVGGAPTPVFWQYGSFPPAMPRSRHGWLDSRTVCARWSPRRTARCRLASPRTD